MQREALGTAYSAAWHCIVRQRIRNWVSNLAEANPRRRADHRCSAGRHKMGRGAGFAVVIALTGEMCGRLHDLAFECVVGLSPLALSGPPISIVVSLAAPKQKAPPL